MYIVLSFGSSFMSKKIDLHYILWISQFCQADKKAPASKILKLCFVDFREVLKWNSLLQFFGLLWACEILFTKINSNLLWIDFVCNGGSKYSFYNSKVMSFSILIKNVTLSWLILNFNIIELKRDNFQVRVSDFSSQHFTTDQRWLAPANLREQSFDFIVVTRFFFCW